NPASCSCHARFLRRLDGFGRLEVRLEIHNQPIDNAERLRRRLRNEHAVSVKLQPGRVLQNVPRRFHQHNPRRQVLFEKRFRVRLAHMTPSSGKTVSPMYSMEWIISCQSVAFSVPAESRGPERRLAISTATPCA